MNKLVEDALYASRQIETLLFREYTYKLIHTVEFSIGPPTKLKIWISLRDCSKMDQEYWDNTIIKDKKNGEGEDCHT